MVTVQFPPPDLPLSDRDQPGGPEQSDLDYAVASLLDIIRQSRLDAILWILADASGRIVARAVPEDPATAAELRAPLDALRPGAALPDAGHAFAEARRTGQSARRVRPSGCAGSGGSPPCLEGMVTLASPVIHNGGQIGLVGCVIPEARGQQAFLGLVESLLSTAVSACGHVLKARQSVRELALLRQAMGGMAAREPCLIIDADRRVQHVTRAAAGLLHCPKSLLIGHRLDGFLAPGLADALFGRSAENGRGGLRPPVTGRFTAGGGTLSVTLCATPIREHNREREQTGARSGALLGWNVALSCGAIPGDGAGERSGRADAPRYRFADIICADPAHRQLIRFARMVARSSSNILITGESGTGKELFAQSIHRESPYASGPFVALNCSSLPRDLIETELFGYQEGAFTGARRGGYKGKVMQADTGTLFLDEIGDMPLELQSRLLRVLQERVILPVGGSKSLPVNIRLVAATNKSLEDRVAAGAFRADLYYRLNVVRIHLIPLRDRPADILPLARHFLSVYSARLERVAEGFTPEAERLLLEYGWPGNVRELENAVECAVNILDGTLVEGRHLRLARGAPGEPRPAPRCGGGSPPAGAEEAILSLEEYEMRQIVNALEQCGGNISDAAKALHIGRTTFYRKLKKYRLEKKIQIHKGTP